jgi:ectoine hydroxylase-related dioxygenase (phytanoyl-CoA dioxygenase family)
VENEEQVGKEEFNAHVTRMQRDGFTVLPALLSAEECDEARHQLDLLAPQRQRGGFECLFNKARIFERFYAVEDLLRFVRFFLGEDALLSAAHGSILEPGQGGGGLHADGAITGHNREQSMAAADKGKRITSHVMAFNVIWCISEFTATNGATCLAPGSHRYEGLDLPPDAAEKARPVVAPRGSALVFDVNIWHGPSKNRSDAARYAAMTPWRRYWQRCEYEMARVVKDDVLERAGEEGRRIFGIGAQSPYLEVWQWDRDRGGPKDDWQGLARS